MRQIDRLKDIHFAGDSTSGWNWWISSPRSLRPLCFNCAF